LASFSPKLALNFMPKVHRIKLNKHIDGGFGEVRFLGIVNVVGGGVVDILILAGIGQALICIVGETALLIIEIVLLRRVFLQGLLLQRVLVGIIGKDDLDPLYINTGVRKVLDYLRQRLLDFQLSLGFRYEESAYNLACGFLKVYGDSAETRRIELDCYLPYAVLQRGLHRFLNLPAERRDSVISGVVFSGLFG